MTLNMDTLERATLELTKRVLADFSAELSTVGLTAQTPTVTANATVDGVRDSEVSVYITRDGDIVDALEFHILRAGKVVASLTETEAWLQYALRDAITKIFTFEG